jgi:WD40 repeat protein
LNSRRELHTLSGHAGSITAVAVTSDGQQVVSASGDTLKVWELSSGRELHTLCGYAESVTAVAVTPGGQRAVSDGQSRN